LVNFLSIFSSAIDNFEVFNELSDEFVDDIFRELVLDDDLVVGLGAPLLFALDVLG
jgi:hypothetical protein